MEKEINNLKTKKHFSYSRISLILAIIFLFPGIFGLFFLQFIPLILAIISLIKSKNQQAENKKIAIATIIIFFVFSPPVIFGVMGNLSALFSPRVDNKTADAVLTRDFSMCNNLPKDSQIPCYGMIAELNEKIDDCDKISESEWQKKCQDRIAGKNLRNICNSTIIMDIEICDHANDPDCINAWNRIKNDPQLCNTLLKKNQNDCYNTVALGICNHSYCNYITDNELKLECYLKSAIRNIGGVNICNEINDLNIKKECFNKYGRNIYMTTTDF